jgi:hypothetical protein
MAVTINASTTTGLVQTADTSGVLQLQTANTTAVTVDASQNVGIGTTSPTSQLSVQTTAGSSTGFLKFTDVTYGGDVRFGKNTGISNDAILGTWVANNVLFYASGAEAMRIDSGGNLCIGTTGAASFDSCKVAVDAASDVFRVRSNSGFVFRFFAAGTFTTVGSIQTTASATSYNTSSDYRLKENIVPMTGALDKVSQLKPVTYKWKIDGSNGQGFIAHELAEVIPDCVSGEKDAVDDEGNPSYQGVDTSFLVATLTAAIKEQQTIINDLKARITALEGAA